MNLISIIIPTYNRGHLIHETLDSILAQQYKSWECIVVDDGSTDDTGRVLNEYSLKDERFKYLIRPANLKKGAPSCRNFGFEKAKGEYVQWFDSDDIMLPEMLQRKFDALTKHPESDFVVSKMGKFQDRDDLTYVDYPIWSKQPVRDYLLYKIYFLTPGPLFRKRYLDTQKVLFDVNLVKHQEWEFYSRLVVTGGRVMPLNEFHCLRRMHDESIKSITDKLSPQIKNTNKFNAILALDRNTDHRFNRMLFSLFYKRVGKIAVKNLMKFNIKQGFVFTGMLLKLLAPGLNSPKG